MATKAIIQFGQNIITTAPIINAPSPIIVPKELSRLLETESTSFVTRESTSPI